MVNRLFEKLICFVFSTQFFDLLYLFAKLYWLYISTIDTYSVFSALLFLQTEERRKRGKDYASIWPIAKYREMVKGEDVLSYEQKIRDGIDSFCFDGNEQKTKTRFSRSVLQRERVWMFIIMSSLLFSTMYIVRQVVRDYRFVVRVKFFLRKFFARKKAVNLPFSLLTLIKAYSKFEYKWNFAQLFSYNFNFVINYLLFSVAKFAKKDWESRL